MAATCATSAYCFVPASVWCLIPDGCAAFEVVAPSWMWRVKHNYIEWHKRFGPRLKQDLFAS
ncbi:hypothetical protein CLH39_00930 [Alcaligenes faecalis]|nr:hypothetical protein CLH39_00930 [Alcaligenes faecalis]